MANDPLSIDCSSTRVLRGPNVHADVTCLEATLTVSVPEKYSLHFLAGRLAQVLPESAWAMAGELRQGQASDLTVARLVARATIGIQQDLGAQVSFCDVQPTSTPGEFVVVVQYSEEGSGKSSLALALRLVRDPMQPSDDELFETLRQLRNAHEDERLGPSTGGIAAAAARRGIPFSRINQGSFVRLGQGAKQRRIWAAETDQTSAIAESIAQDKDLTKFLLHAVGVPVPFGLECPDASKAWELAQKVGLPVVVKPRRGNQGRGVSVNLSSREAIEAAFEIANRHEGGVVIERFITGDDYRVLVVGGRVVAASRREPPKVLGDGQHTIRELVAKVNLDPRRSDGHSTSLTKLRLDDIASEVLEEQGLTPDSVPALDRVVLLRRNANLSTGGSAVDVTDTVHPEVVARAIDAARMVGLDIAGIDVVAPRIDVPMEVSGGAVVEVNAAPGLRMHLDPSEGTPRDVGSAIVDMLFPKGHNGRIPTVTITGTNGKTTTTRCVAHLFRTSGLTVGMTCTDGIYVDDMRVDTGDCSGPKSARLVLSHPQVQAAVLETARGGMLREGLGFDWCDVAIVTNVADGDHLGMRGSETLEDLVKVKSLPVRRVAPWGAAVLNAADPLVADMAQLCRGTVILFARDAADPRLVQHRAQGGRAVFTRGGRMWLAEGPQERPLLEVASLPITHGGRIGFQVDNMLASAAAGWFLGLEDSVLRMALATFHSDTGTVPARFNLIEHAGATIILDYGHNAAALRALVEAVGSIEHERRVVVYTAAGDRRDEDIIEQARILGDAFDEIVVYEDQCTRGREPGVIIELMKQGLALGTRLKLTHHASGEMAAIQLALDNLRAKDLLLCQIDQVDLGLEFVNKWLAAHGASAVAVGAKSA